MREKISVEAYLPNDVQLSGCILNQKSSIHLASDDTVVTLTSDRPEELLNALERAVDCLKEMMKG